MAEPIIQCENLVKIYKTKDLEVLALQGLELTIEKGELMAIIGNSGSGKSTFLNMIGGLDRPSAGRLIVDGKDLFKLDEKALVMSSDVIEAVKRLDRAGNPFDFIFMDPPYRMDLPKKVLEALKDTCLADEETLIIVEEALEADFSWVCALGYEIVKSKEYKTNKHVFLRKKEN